MFTCSRYRSNIIVATIGKTPQHRKTMRRALKRSQGYVLVQPSILFTLRPPIPSSRQRYTYKHSPIYPVYVYTPIPCNTQPYTYSRPLQYTALCILPSPPVHSPMRTPIPSSAQLYTPIPSSTQPYAYSHPFQYIALCILSSLQ